MIWILIIILTHPILVKPELYTMTISPKIFFDRNTCESIAGNEAKKKSVYVAYCQEIKPVIVK